MDFSPEIKMWDSGILKGFEGFLKPGCLLRCFNQIQNWTFVNPCSSDGLDDNMYKKRRVKARQKWIFDTAVKQAVVKVLAAHVQLLSIQLLKAIPRNNLKSSSSDMIELLLEKKCGWVTF